MVFTVSSCMVHVTKTSKKVSKVWGYELWLANNLEEDYCGKILHVDPGHRFSMHFHVNKHETFYILRGSCKLHTIDTETATESVLDLNEGDSVEIDRYTPHQIEALTEVDIIEISTYHRDSDSHRVWRN